MTDRVLVVLQEDVVDGNTGDPLWPAGMRLEVDRGSARVYIREGVAVLAEDADSAQIVGHPADGEGGEAGQVVDGDGVTHTGVVPVDGGDTT